MLHVPACLVSRRSPTKLLDWSMLCRASAATHVVKDEERREREGACLQRAALQFPSGQQKHAAKQQMQETVVLHLNRKPCQQPASLTTSPPLHPSCQGGE